MLRSFQKVQIVLTALIYVYIQTKEILLTIQSMVFTSDVVTSSKTEGQLLVGSPSDSVCTALFNISTPKKIY